MEACAVAVWSFSGVSEGIGVLDGVGGMGVEVDGRGVSVLNGVRDGVGGCVFRGVDDGPDVGVRVDVGETNAVGPLVGVTAELPPPQKEKPLEATITPSIRKGTLLL